MDPSSLTKTSFSGKTVDNVTNNELKKFILDDMKLKCQPVCSFSHAKYIIFIIYGLIYHCWATADDTATNCA